MFATSTCVCAYLNENYHLLYSLNNFVSNKSNLPQDGAQYYFLIWDDRLLGERPGMDLGDFNPTIVQKATTVWNLKQNMAQDHCFPMWQPCCFSWSLLQHDHVIVLIWHIQLMFLHLEPFDDQNVMVWQVCFLALPWQPYNWTSIFYWLFKITLLWISPELLWISISSLWQIKDDNTPHLVCNIDIPMNSSAYVIISTWFWILFVYIQEENIAHPTKPYMWHTYGSWCERVN